MCLQIILINQDLFFLFNESATTEIYTLSLHDALPISTGKPRQGERYAPPGGDQPSAPDLRELIRAGAAAPGRSRLHVFGAARGRGAGPGLGSARSLRNAGLRR